MRQLAWFAVLILSTAAALGQRSSSTDVLCTPLEHLGENACSFGDGSGELISPSSVQHYTAEEWGRMYPTLIKADDDAKAEQIRSNTEAEVRLRAENEREITAIKAQAERGRMAFAFTLNHDKKKCVAAGFEWSGNRLKGVCRAPEAK